MTRHLIIILLCVEPSFILATFVQHAIPNGQLLGSIQQDKNGADFYSFTGIPFAEPPVGRLRFRAPVAKRPWSGVLNSTIPAPMCPQFFYEDVVGQEDCLFLNVYTKSLDARQSSQPVMVYIYGGSYSTGSSAFFGPHFLLTADVVLVTINYRLGFLGTLSFHNQSSGVPGNANLKDQVMALRWIQENIRYFGGDPDVVTVFGESVGGASAHMHLLSPMSRGLVHRVIAQSGCALSAWNRGMLGTGEMVADVLGIAKQSTEDIIKHLQDMPLEEFMIRVQGPFPAGVLVDVPNNYGPVIESQRNEPQFMPRQWLDLIDEAPKVPLLLGYNNNDSLIFQVQARLGSGREFLITDLNRTIPWNMNIPDSARDALMESIRHTFFDNRNSTNRVDLIANYMLGPWFITGYLRTIEEHLASNHIVYYYRFSADTKLNFFKRSHPVTAQYRGACHLDELGYLFTVDGSPCIEADSIEDLSWRRMVKFWTDFARTGNPTPDNEPMQWSRVRNTNDIDYMEINAEDFQVAREPNEMIMNFWRSVYRQYNHD